MVGWSVVLCLLRWFDEQLKWYFVGSLLSKPVLHTCGSYLHLLPGVDQVLKSDFGGVECNVIYNMGILVRWGTLSCILMINNLVFISFYSSLFGLG